MPVTVQRYDPRTRRAVLNFVRQQQYVQQHLDWRPTQEWLRDEHEFIFVATDQSQIVALLAFASPRGDVAWLRMIALRDNCSFDVVQPVFDLAAPVLQAAGAQRIRVLEMNAWLYTLLEQNGFCEVDHLVHLQRLTTASHLAHSTDYQIIRANRRHIETVVPIDHAAFAVDWQMAEVDFNYAMSYAGYFTIALINRVPVGYQLSTRYGDEVHLARLAVLPAYVGHGVGTQLVVDLINHFPRRRITVNTQASNEGAIRLYQRLGFEPEKFITPVWQKPLN